MSISIYGIFDVYKHPSPYVVSLDKVNRVAKKQTVSSEAHTNMADTLFLVCYCYFNYFKLYGNSATMNYMEQKKKTKKNKICILATSHRSEAIDGTYRIKILDLLRAKKTLI